MQLNVPARLLIAAAIAAGAGCGTASPTAPTATLAFTLSASPNSITGVLCAGCGAGSTDRESKTTIAIAETGGAAGTVTSIAMVLRENGSNLVIAQGEFDAAAVTQLAGSNHVAARGTLNVTCGVHYAASEQGKAATLTYTVRVVDDRGNTVTHDVVVAVTTT